MLAFVADLVKNSPGVPGPKSLLDFLLCILLPVDQTKSCNYIESLHCDRSGRNKSEQKTTAAFGLLVERSLLFSAFQTYRKMSVSFAIKTEVGGGQGLVARKVTGGSKLTCGNTFVRATQQICTTLL